MASPTDSLPGDDATHSALDAALRDLHREVLQEPLSATLLETAQRFSHLQQERSATWRWSGMAASVLLAFGVGWFTHGQTQGQLQPAAAFARGTAQQEFVRQAGFAHGVYLPEKRHPVEVAAADQEHLVQWLSKRLGKPLKVPNLETQGFSLVGGRLLPGDTGARAQFMFQNAAGQRVTLYLGAVDPGTQTAGVQDTQFRYVSEGATPSFYWAEQGFGYALSGQLEKSTLMALAHASYQQLLP